MTYNFGILGPKTEEEIWRQAGERNAEAPGGPNPPRHHKPVNFADPTQTKKKLDNATTTKTMLKCFEETSGSQ